MKKLILTLLVVTGIFSLGKAQTDGVTFVPGLGEDTTIWDAMSNQLQNDDFEFTKNTIDYNGYDSISTSATNTFIPIGEVVVAHSQGGLVSREYLRRNGTTGLFKALVTVGTPHEGAPIVNNALNGNATFVIGDMVKKLLLGPAVYADLFGGNFADTFIAVGLGALRTGQNSLQDHINNKYSNQPGINDMKPNSSFLSTLNQNAGNTLPSARYAIFGAEKAQTPWHLIGSLIAGAGNVESSAGINIHDTLQGIYATATNVAAYNAFVYRQLKERAKDNYNFNAYMEYLEKMRKWETVRDAFNIGHHNLLIGGQLAWSAYVTGSATSVVYQNQIIVDYTAYSEDGILSAETQAPQFIAKNDGTNRRLEAREANHLEQTAHPNVKARLIEVFQNSDVNIPQNDGGSPGGGGDDGDQCFTDRFGNCIDF